MAQFVCQYDGETFEQKSRYERHLASAHPPPAVSAADIEKALTGIDYPKRKRELVAYAAQRVPSGSEVLRVIEMLPDRIYRDAAEVAIAFGELKAPPGRSLGRARFRSTPFSGCRGENHGRLAR